MTNQYPGEDRRAPQPESWHLKKEVNLSMIISLIGVAVACVMGYADLKRDIELIKADALVLHQRDNQQGVDLDKAITVLQAHYQRMDAKLDRLIERSQK